LFLFEMPGKIVFGKQ